VPVGAGFPLERRRQRGVPPKRHYFVFIGSYSVKTVADGTDMLLIITSNSDKLFIGVNVNDLE